MPGQYRVLLNEDWDLEDLYDFPHAYSQCYAFIYCFDSEIQPRDRSRINEALESYPWRGGYSYVNIYFVLKAQIPHQDRPKIRAIRKESPGWLDLLLNPQVAAQVAASVATLSGGAVAAAAAYKKAYGYLLSVNASRRRAAAQRMTATASELKAFNSLCVELAKNLGFKNLAELHQRTGNTETSLKLLLAHHRRLQDLTNLQESGKISLPLEGPKSK